MLALARGGGCWGCLIGRVLAYLCTVNKRAGPHLMGWEIAAVAVAQHAPQEQWWYTLLSRSLWTREENTLLLISTGSWWLWFIGQPLARESRGTHTHTCTHARAHTQTHTHVCTHRHMSAQTQTNRYTLPPWSNPYIQCLQVGTTHTHTLIHTYRCAQAHTYTHMHTQERKRTMRVR